MLVYGGLYGAVMATFTGLADAAHGKLTDSQMGWVLRPFIGNPTLPVTFFRAEQWGNAYVEVLETIRRSLAP